MGNDMSVFEEGELEKDFWKAHGPKNESWTEFLSRSFAGLTKILMQPKRMEYSPDDVESRSEDTDFRHEFFTIRGSDAATVTSSSKGGVMWSRSRSRSSSSDASSGGSADLAAVLWQQWGRGPPRQQQCGSSRQDLPSTPPRPLVLYLHTNTRSLVDAKELLPLCDHLGASLMAFDLPGCGHSGGHLTFQMTQDLHRVVLYARQVLGFEEIVLWARGMATALAVEYCASPPPCSPPAHICVKFVVLDSPFTSVKQMVLDGSKAVKCFGLAIPEALVRLACRVVRGKVSAKLGSDPFDLKPLRLVEKVVEQQKQGSQEQLPPCHIFSALQDDYIPAEHGHNLQRAWAEGGAHCGLREFAGRHFGERDSELLLGEGLPGRIGEALVFDKQAEENAALASLSLNMGMGNSAFLLLGANKNRNNSGKVPWAGVW